MVNQILLVSATVLVLASAPLAAQPCTPIASEDLGQPSQPGMFYTLGATVPPGEAWIVRAAGVGYSVPIPGGPLEYSLNIAHPVGQATTAENLAIDSGCCWQIPVQTAVKTGTPVLALDHPIVLLAGERLLARVTGPPSQLVMNLFTVMWKVPASCVVPTGIRGQ